MIPAEETFDLTWPYAPETVAARVEQFIQINNPPVVVSSPPGRAWNDNERWKKD